MKLEGESFNKYYFSFCSSRFKLLTVYFSMLEQQSIALKKVQSGPLDNYKEALSSAVRRCYLELGEEDTWMSLKAEACIYPGLAYAASVDMYGKLHEALQTFDVLIDQCENDHKDLNSTPPSDTEMTLIEDRWISLQRETCQWAVLSDLAEDSCFSKLKMECAWKNRDWEKLRNLCASPAAVSGLELGDIDVKMNEIFLAIYDGKLNEIENLHAQTAQLCLYKWQLLPSLHAGCNAHVTLLRNFNRLVDIRESGQIMVEARYVHSFSSCIDNLMLCVYSFFPLLIPHLNNCSQYTSGKSYPDLKNLLTAWRNRLPNDHESISTWDEIFQWRSHMFTAITNKFHFAEQSTLASLHDRPWTAIRMARTARQLGVPEVSLLSLSKLTDCAMDVADAFSKLNEQILSYRNGSEDEKKGGLNLINTTNLSYFDSSQKSEIFRLKADFLESLGGKTKATQAYCHAVQLCPTYARAWTSWGGLCWSLSDLVEAQSRRQQSSESAEDKAKKASNAKKVCQYLAQSMGCYLEAIHCESSEESRVHIPRCLTMLVKDGMSPGLLCSTFEKYAAKLPSWVWLPWIPQLLSSLCRTESKAVKLLLHGILTTYPQSVYFSLRSFYLERRDQERSKQSSSDNPSGSTSVSCAEDLMSNLRKSQPTLWMSLESILEELIIRFRPSYEEELLATITALLQRADTQLEQQSRGKDADEEAVRGSFSKTLSRVSEKFFRTQSDNSSVTKDDRAKKTADFTMRYKESFERDFSMLDKEKKEKLSLDDIISKLNKWKKILETRVSSTPPCLPLMQVSPSLSAFTNAAPDLWEGACDSPGSKPLSPNRNLAESDKDSSPSSSAAAALKAAINASTAVRTASTFEGSGGSQGSGWTTVEIPGQYAPNICADERPHPELHAKLIKFESTVEVSRRNDQLVRRIGMVGSDGKVHQFLLQFAIPYWTRTDERTTQLQQLLGKCLRKESISCRRNLWLRPTAVIPIAQRLRMIAEDKDHVSLDEIYATDCIANGRDYSEASNIMQNKIRNLAPLVEGDDSESAKKAKMDAFINVCSIVSPHILSNHIRNSYSSAEEYFHFQRTFASQTALNSLLQYAFCVSERTPCKFIFNKKTGHILSPDFRFSYSNQGFADEKKAVPFRLTRNIEEFIGPFLMKGIVTPAMASAATAICKNESNLEQALQLLCRDDIVSWYLSKSSQREGSQRSTQDLERQLADRVKKNVLLIQSRFHECAVKSIRDDVEKRDSTCDKGVKKLLSIATSAENVVSMPLNYAGWL
jgi:transformation/transcription domain-associated protein